MGLGLLIVLALVGVESLVRSEPQGKEPAPTVLPEVAQGFPQGSEATLPAAPLPVPAESSGVAAAPSPGPEPSSAPQASPDAGTPPGPEGLAANPVPAPSTPEKRLKEGYSIDFQASNYLTRKEGIQPLTELRISCLASLSILLQNFSSEAL